MTLVKRKKPRDYISGIEEYGIRRSRKDAAPIHQLPRQSDRWSLKKNGVRQTPLHLWLRCREQFRLQMVEGWGSYRYSAAIDNGNLWHWLLDQRHNEGKIDIDKMLKSYSAGFKSDNPSAGMPRLEALQLSMVQARTMWPMYCKLYPDEWKWLGVEKSFHFKHDANDRVYGMRPDSRISYPIPVGGIWDGVFRHKDGKIWLFETKTKSMIDEFEIADGLQLDLQVMLYLYAIKVVYGEYPAGVCYNVIRKPTVRKAKSRTPEEHGAILGKDLTKRPDHYFKRWWMKVKPKEVDGWVTNTLDQILLDVYLWAEGISGHYVTTKNLVGRFGRCDMFEVITDNDYSNVFRRKKEPKDLLR